MFTKLELYASDGTTLLARQYNGSGKYFFSRIVWTALSTGTYYLKVSGPQLMEGNYALQVLGAAGLRYVHGTVTADTGVDGAYRSEHHDGRTGRGTLSLPPSLMPRGWKSRSANPSQSMHRCWRNPR
ncbi:MAG: PPC domain-containing protein [Coriobacteriia bacterium]|nr:PPC domain-containing protein [Coriobacteriia bacterium]